MHVFEATLPFTSLGCFGGRSNYNSDLGRYGLLLSILWTFITLHAQCERGKVIGVGVHIYVCGPKKILNRILAIDSPFQTCAVGLLVEFID